MGLAVSALYLLLAIVIILGVAWVICWLLRTFVPQVPAQVQNFVYIVAVIICIIKVVIWAGGVGAFAAERHDVGRAAVVHERVVPRLDVHRHEPAFVAPRRLRGCDRVLRWRCW